MLETNSESFKNSFISSIEDQAVPGSRLLQHPHTGLDILRLKARHHDDLLLSSGSLLAGQERPDQGTVEPERAGLDWWRDWILPSDQEVDLRAEISHIGHNAGVAE